MNIASSTASHKQHAWIFLSVGPDLASIDVITDIADGINHARPTQKELQQSLGWLVRNGLINKTGKKYNLTESGQVLRATNSKTMLEAWDIITKKLMEKDL